MITQMEEDQIYIDKLNLFGINVQFVFRGGKMHRITGDPNDIPYNFEPITNVFPEQWTRVYSIFDK